MAAAQIQSSPADVSTSPDSGVQLNNSTAIRMAEILPAGVAALYLPKSESVTITKPVELPRTVNLPVLNFAASPMLREGGAQLIVMTQDRDLFAAMVVAEPLVVATKAAEFNEWKIDWLSRRTPSGGEMWFGEAKQPTGNPEDIRYGPPILSIVAIPEQQLLFYTSNSRFWAAMAGRVLRTEILQTPYTFPTLSSSLHWQSLMSSNARADEVVYSAAIPDILEALYLASSEKKPAPTLLIGKMHTDAELGTVFEIDVHHPGRELPLVNALAEAELHPQMPATMLRADLFLHVRLKSGEALYAEWLNWMANTRFQGDHVAVRAAEQQLMQSLQMSSESISGAIGDEVSVACDTNTGQWVIAFSTPNAERTTAIIRKGAEAIGFNSRPMDFRGEAFITLTRDSTGTDSIFLRQLERRVLLASGRGAAGRTFQQEYDGPRHMSGEEPILLWLDGTAVAFVADQIGIINNKEAVTMPPFFVRVRADNDTLKFRVSTRASLEALCDQLVIGGNAAEATTARR